MTMCMCKCRDLSVLRQGLELEHGLGCLDSEPETGPGGAAQQGGGDEGCDSHAHTGVCQPSKTGSGSWGGVGMALEQSQNTGRIGHQAMESDCVFESPIAKNTGKHF